MTPVNQLWDRENEVMVATPEKAKLKNAVPFLQGEKEEIKEDLLLPLYRIEDMQQHVEHTTYEIKPEDRKKSQCIDGRYEQKDNAAVAIPWGDAGQLEVMISALKKTNKKSELNKTELKRLAKILIDTVGTEKDLSFHTDEHHHKHGIGCGHLAKGKNHPKEYGLSRREMRFVMKFMNASVKKWAKNILLAWDHKERGIAIINSKNKSIYNQDATGNQVFVFNKTAVEERNALLAEKIQEVWLSKDDIRSTMNAETTEHLMTTAGKIAPGKPIFEVDLDGEKAKIISQWIVREKDEEKKLIISSN
jgi:hypothetical protein